MTHDIPNPLPSIEVACGAEVPRCRRCTGEGILSARIPHGWLNTHGHRITGTVLVVLCQRCDISEPAGGALAAWFAVHGEINAENLATAAPLIRAWAATLTPPAFDQTTFDVDLAAWQRGEFDE